MFTIEALLGDDIRLTSFNLPSDNTFNTMAVIGISLFAYEFLASGFISEE